MTKTQQQRSSDRLHGEVARRVRKQTDFKAHVFAYVLVNWVIVELWASMGGGFFWPIFPMLAWGVGIALNAWYAYRRPELQSAT